MSRPAGVAEFGEGFAPLLPADRGWTARNGFEVSTWGTASRSMHGERISELHWTVRMRGITRIEVPPFNHPPS